MSFFFPRTVYHSTPVFNPLASLLSELQQPRPQYCQRPRETQHKRPAYRMSVRPWEPRFEARETEDSYVIYGELPGLSKEHITVEFPEDRKLVVGAKVEHNATAATAPAEPAAQEAGPAAEPVPDDARSRSPFQATVEDDDEDDFEVLSHTSEKSQSEKPQQKKPEPAVQKVEPKQQPTEQVENQHSGYTIQEFSRYFTFPTDVNHEFVTADLKDGLLQIVVPKAKKYEPRRILIN
ncbi:hypothetical protein S40285_02579 [Stachybotrys chlorohalonatus IBT 40285]|uniref:SHSP domain-containing protein n=1 Tax=Stachybotrys chlorohalonatus (strain IBT 40285) TaxID=1283841 RepID=A0A084QVV6_STAC4|nr:hypothetical protein S40285_02579 [Stachybotrys chlorohalonata IBT 40285]